MIKELTDFDSRKWNDFIISKAESNIFHTSNWLKVLRDVYGYEITLLIKVNGNDEIIAGIPVAKLGAKYVSLPFSDYVPLLNIEGNNKIVDELISKDNNAKPLSIVLKEKINNEKFICVSSDVIHFGYFDGDFEGVSRGFSEMHRRGMRKAVKAGLIVKIDKSFFGVKKYYDLHLMTRKRQGVPVQPFSFFINLFDEVIDKGMGFVGLVFKGDVVVSGGVFLYFNKTFTYKFGASDLQYLDLRPNNLLFYEMIRYAVVNGFKVFDFGKTDMENEGLRKFKSGWGAVEKPLFYSYYPEYKPSRLFGFVKNRIVAPIIKVSPKFVCRVIGEVFYRFMG